MGSKSDQLYLIATLLDWLSNTLHTVDKVRKHHEQIADQKQKLEELKQKLAMLEQELAGLQHD